MTPWHLACFANTCLVTLAFVPLSYEGGLDTLDGALVPTLSIQYRVSPVPYRFKFVSLLRYFGIPREAPEYLSFSGCTETPRNYHYAWTEVQHSGESTRYRRLCE